MTERKLDLKNPWVAGVLAFLVPGGGHLYQKRYFKGVLYFVCILGTFLFGMYLGEWRAVYWTENPGGAQFGRPQKKNLGFLAQAGVGAPSLVAYVQSRRYRRLDNSPVVINYGRFDPTVLNRFAIIGVNPHDDNDRNDNVAVRFSPLDGPIETEFRGRLEQFLPQDRGDAAEIRSLGVLQGTIQLEPLNKRFKGTFRGTLTPDEGPPQQVEYELGQSLLMDSPILGDPRRKVFVQAVGGDVQDDAVHTLAGSVKRSFGNWFLAPLDEAVLQDLNRRLNKRFEMALVYTWIAGLLNILVIWDAVQGPAYGFGDEQQPDPKRDKSQDKNTAESESPAPTKAAEKQEEIPAPQSGAG